MDSKNVIKKYDQFFQTFMARNIEKSKMASISMELEEMYEEELVICLKKNQF